MVSEEIPKYNSLSTPRDMPFCGHRTLSQFHYTNMTPQSNHISGWLASYDLRFSSKVLSSKKNSTMKKTALFLLLITGSFLSGYTFHTFVNQEELVNTKKVTGIGGIFFKCKDPNSVREWYQKNLGLHTNQYGSVFEWYQGSDSTKKGFTQWSPFADKTKYFLPSTKDFMINYRVENLEALARELKNNDVIITDSVETFEYGKKIT